MALLVRPFRPPFFINKHRMEAQRLENLSQHWTLLNRGFSFYAVLMRPLFTEAAGNALVGDRPFASILANTEDLARVTQLAIGLVIQRVSLQRAGGDTRKTKRREL